MGGLLFLAVIIGWFCFCVWLARKIARWIPIESTITKAVISVLVFTLFVPLPLIDEIVGKIQFDRLCRKEAGVKIYGKLELGPEFFNTDGSTNLINKMGNLDDERFNSLFKIINKPSEKVSKVADITKGGLIIESVTDKRKLLDETEFGFHGGWLAYDRNPWLFETGCASQRRRLSDLVNKIISRK